MKFRKIIGMTAFFVALAALGGCKRNYEEFYFKGTAVSMINCSSRMMGYVIEVEKPEGVGDTVTIGGVHYKNAVLAYRAPRIIKQEETIYGVAYVHRDFGALNCVVVPLFTLPEWGLISVDEKPEVIE